jgi:hypothetical protein
LYDEVTHKLLAVIGWSYLFFTGSTYMYMYLISFKYQMCLIFSNKWILSIFCERQISTKLFFVSNTSMHSQLLGYLLGFLLCHYVSFRAEFRVVLPVTISAWKRCSVRRYHQLFGGGFMSLLRYMCLLAHSSVQYILWVFFFVLCTLRCLFLWIVHFWLPRRCSLTFI